MLLDMTIANFKSVKEPQTISFEAVRDNRFPESKVVAVTDKLKIIKSGAIIGPNGAGKSTFIRALEALLKIVSASDEVEDPLQVLSRTSFAYSEEKGLPMSITIRAFIGYDEETQDSVVAQYTLVSDRNMIHEESLFHIVGRSRKRMFLRELNPDSILLDESEPTYRYRWGKGYRGDKKRLVNRLSPRHTFLQASAARGSETTQLFYSWMQDQLHILPMGVSPRSEQYLVEQLTAHPEWVPQLVNFLYSLDITDIRDIRVRDDRLIFVHTNVTQHFAEVFNLESLSLRRLCLIGVAFFESFITQKTLVIDDFGMLLHPYVLTHIVEIFEACNSETGSQMLVVDCNPSLLEPGLLRRDGVYFAEKDSDSATIYTSLANFRYSKARDRTQVQYMAGAFGSLPILSEFNFTPSAKEE